MLVIFFVLFKIIIIKLTIKINIKKTVSFGISGSFNTPLGNSFEFQNGGIVSLGYGFCKDLEGMLANNIMRGVISIENGEPRTRRTDSAPCK